MDPDPVHPDEEDSVSPLRSFSSTTVPPPSPRCHTAVAKQEFDRLTFDTLKKAASSSPVRPQSRRFASSPLDTIPSNIYARFPRFSTTTENSTPDLSTEEVTSTRLSIDEHDIIRVPQPTATSSGPGRKRQKMNTALRKAISTPSLSLRRVRDRLRRAPSSTLSGNTLQQEATSTLGEQSQACGSPSTVSSNTPTATATKCNVDQVSEFDATSASSCTQKSPGSSIQVREDPSFPFLAVTLQCDAPQTSYFHHSAATIRQRHISHVLQPIPDPLHREPLDRTIQF
jgi:hypothetical protein